MRATSKVVALMVAIMLGGLVPLFDIDRGDAQQEPKPARPARGGAVTRTAHYRFEVYCYSSGLRIFITDSAGNPVSASALRGTATFYHPNSPSPWFARPLRPAPTQPGQPAESLDLSADLSTVPESGATETLEIGGLPDQAEATAKFTLPFVRVDAASDSPRARRATAPASGKAASSEPVHYYGSAGFYGTTSGTTIWVPAAGYYYDNPAQSYARAHPDPASGWQAARPAPAPGAPSVPRSHGQEGSVHSEYYWHARAFAGTGEHQAWLRGQMRQQKVGRTPAITERECARCHRR